MMSREEQISRLQENLRDVQEEASHKESSLQKLERDLISAEEVKHKTDDSVSGIWDLFSLLEWGHWSKMNW